MARVRPRKVCELQDREVSSSEIGKGYEISRDHIVPVSDQELRDLPLPTRRRSRSSSSCRCRPSIRSGSATPITSSLTGRWRRSRTSCSARRWPVPPE
ncbi:Ku protein [Streptomyces flaveolus]|uniref:Ku protein n=1 Tax=Streptomyces flaveolus TaxID=67297 RepID=UPI0036F5DEF3